MVTLKLLFWLLIFIVFYAYVGYGILLFLLIKIKRLLGAKAENTTTSELPEVTFIVAAFNEERWIEDKIKNSLALDYPKDKIRFFFVTDGSDDSTPDLIKNYPNTKGYHIELFHQPERKGKIAAVERIMPFVKTPITVFTDANTDLNPEAIKSIVKCYQDPKVGAVAGEKRVEMSSGEASGAGEGIYWKYESLLKKWDAELYSAVGAAGELFSIRTNLYQPVSKDTLIEDFVMTLQIAMKGYTIAYAPEAFAVEGQSADVKEELKRKIRISAGGLQAVWRLRGLLNPFKYGVLTFQYISHRVLRWTLAPLALPFIFIINILIAKESTFYTYIMYAQVFFYSTALLGWIFEQMKMKVKAFYVPYYFCVMNYSVYRGFFRLVAGKQSVVWEKSKRA
jgi:cellulose synthase/poly-beta-1,6-N-acetylglucosamine synthase-like glycosyltransferase